MRQAVSVRQKISGEADAIWATISAGGNVHQWFPVITSCLLEGSGEGASRFCTMIDGTELKESIIEVNHAARQFRYTVDKHPLPAQDITSFIDVKDAGDGYTWVSWGSEFEAHESAISQVKERLQELFRQGIKSLENYHKQI